jgi:hypothetical protein
LLTLVTLLPEDKTLLSVTLQPLLCSDALNLSTDRPNCRPLEAVNSSADCFDGAPPDHIDIVSVATCTPQPETTTRLGSHRQWHQEFRDSFKSAASHDALARHHYATFVLSNFQIIPESTPGGLSGAFIPIPFQDNGCAGFVTVSAWGRETTSSGADKRWSEPDEEISKWSTSGYVASLTPIEADVGSHARMLGFTVHRLPRDTTRWRQVSGLVDLQLQTASRDESGTIVFKRQERQ